MSLATPFLQAAANEKNEKENTRQRDGPSPRRTGCRDGALTPTQRGAGQRDGDRQQTHFHHFAVGWQVLVQVFNLLVERKGTLAAAGNHADQMLAVQTYGVGVFAMEAIDQPLLRIGGVLRDFLDEALVVEAMDGLELDRKSVV